MENAVDRIYQYIKDSGLEPGDKLPIRPALSKALGLGPRVLREALTVLEHQGVIRTQSKAGTLIAEPSAERLEVPFRWYLESGGYESSEMIRARACLEAAAAFEAARQRTARDLLVILDAIEQLEGRQEKGESDLEEELQFHLAILSATHNPVMMTFQKLVVINIHKTCEGASFDNETTRSSNQEHRQLLDAIENKDALKAFELMYAHINRG